MKDGVNFFTFLNQLEKSWQNCDQIQRQGKHSFYNDAFLMTKKNNDVGSPKSKMPAQDFNSNSQSSVQRLSPNQQKHVPRCIDEFGNILFCVGI
jgi:hypothetical protein